MLGSLRSPRATHLPAILRTISTMSSISTIATSRTTSRQQAAGRCSARSARLARPHRWPLSATSSSSTPTVRLCPRPPPSRTRSLLAVCAKGCAWIIIHFGFSVLDNYSFLPLSANNFNKVGGKIPASLLSLLAPRPSASLRRRATTKCGQPSAALESKAGAGFAPASLLSLLAFTGHKCGRLPAALKKRQARASPPPIVYTLAVAKMNNYPKLKNQNE